MNVKAFRELKEMDPMKARAAASDRSMRLSRERDDPPLHPHARTKIDNLGYFVTRQTGGSYLFGRGTYIPDGHGRGHYGQLVHDLTERLEDDIVVKFKVITANEWPRPNERKVTSINTTWHVGYDSEDYVREGVSAPITDRSPRIPTRDLFDLEETVAAVRAHART